MKRFFLILKENWGGVLLFVAFVAYLSISLTTGDCPMCKVAEWVGSE
ncbi:MAG: hypothetical protein MI748_13455 [Opitutales bacterium]|nr:hypothetical protein [Opitutales bacterium]